MDTTENKTEQYTKKPYPKFKPEKQGKYPTNLGELYYDKGGMGLCNVGWTRNIGDAATLKGITWFMEPLSPPMEVKDAEAEKGYRVVKGKHLKYGDAIWCTIDDEGEDGWYTLDPNIDDISELNELEADRNFLLRISSQLQPPVISAEEFLKEKGVATDYYITGHEDVIGGRNVLSLKVADLLTDFLQRQGQKTNQTKL